MKKKDTLSNIILVLILIIGLSLLLYPAFSNWWNSLHQTRVIDSYSEQVAKLDVDRYEAIWNNAHAYNALLRQQEEKYELSEEMTEQYHENLNVAGNGVMGSIHIPAINVTLPVYHTVSETVLQIAIGHIEWTSLPTGGENTHCVLSGHRGLPSAKLFSDLDKMQVGDIFTLQILDEVLTYEVDQIEIVLPYEVKSLEVVEGRDLCTLVTCTPYGINSHRLLVRGTRIDNIEEEREIRITADAVQIEPILVAPMVAAPMLLVLFIALMIPKPKKNRRRDP